MLENFFDVVDFQGKGQSAKGRECVGGKLHSAFSGFFVQVDVRSMWPNDPQGRSSYRDMLVSSQAEEALNVFLSTIFTWLTYGKGDHMIFSVTCLGLN